MIGMLLQTIAWMLLLAAGLAAAPAQAQNAAAPVIVSACGTAPTPLTAGEAGTLYIDTNGNLCDVANFSGTIVIGTVVQGAKGSDAAADSWYVQPGTGAVFPAQPTAGTTGGAASYHVIAAAGDNHAVIKNGAGTAYDVDCSSSSTAAAYIRLYDAGTGFNGCNSATGIVWGAFCPAAASAAGTGASFVKSFPVGRSFATGISICISGAMSDTDTTAAPTSVAVNVGYK